MRKIIMLLIAAMCVSAANAAGRVKFKSDGTLRIVQFTDLHLIQGNKQYRSILDGMQSVIDTEQPDLVIFTGDQVYSNGVGESMNDIIEIVKTRNIPFAVIFGNHDHQFDMSLDDIYDMCQAAPRSLMPKRTESGKYDFVIEVESAYNPRPKYLLYCMDTHDHNPLGKGYDWLKVDQIDWYKQQGDDHADKNGLLPSMLFIHIPLQEYALAVHDKNADKVKKPMLGTKGEGIAHSTFNSGMFLTMLNRGDVRAVFAGHDHDNDFTVELLGMLLGYGRWGGIKEPYGKLPNGARVIELKEQTPDVFETWVRLADGSEINRQTFHYRQIPDTKEAPELVKE